MKHYFANVNCMSYTGDDDMLLVVLFHLSQCDSLIARPPAQFPRVISSYVYLYWSTMACNCSCRGFPVTQVFKCSVPHLDTSSWLGPAGWLFLCHVEFQIHAMNDFLHLRHLISLRALSAFPTDYCSLDTFFHRVLSWGSPSHFVFPPLFRER